MGPAAPSRHELVVTKGPGSGRRYLLSPEGAVIGRSPDADIRLNSENVSRRHALVRRSGSHLVVEDLGSSNGTLLNGDRLTRSEILSPGDRLVLADVVMQLVVPEAQDHAPSDPSYQFGDVAGSVNTGSGAQNVAGGHQNVGSGRQYVAGRDLHHGDRYQMDFDLDGPWQVNPFGEGPARILVVLGAIVCLTGFAIFGWAIFSEFGEFGTPATPGGGPPPDFGPDAELLGYNAFALGFTLFALGGLVCSIGGMWSFNIHRRKRQVEREYRRRHP